MNKLKNKSGITLIALVVTIIVLLILAGISIQMLTGDNGILNRAGEAKEMTDIAQIEERVKLAYTAAIADGNGELTEANLRTELTNEFGDDYDLDEDTTTNEWVISVNDVERLRVSKGATIPQIPEETVIPKDPSENDENGYIGCYADINRDGTIDGIIYADLLVGKPDDGAWGGAYEDYSAAYALPTDVNASNVKDYVVSETAVTDSRFDSSARYVISPASSTTGTKDRFYVMGLDDITDGTNDTLYWYKNAYLNMNDYATATSKAFGTGKTNTDNMIAKWDAEAYGTRDDRDMWKWVKAKRAEYSGWFVPSAGEWAAFANAFSITSTNYSSFGISNAYFACSTQGGVDRAWGVRFFLRLYRQ